jgi:L,D-transpeptidase ErfK/SrfK
MLRKICTFALLVAIAGSGVVANAAPLPPVNNAAREDGSTVPGLETDQSPGGDLDVVVTQPEIVGDILGTSNIHVTWSSDNLLDIARADELGLIEVLAANPGIDPWLPGKNVEILLPSAHLLPDGPRDGIIINVADLRLYFFRGEDEPVVSFPIGVGREGFKTPLGRTKITRKKDGPAWYPTKNARAEDPELPAMVPAGPDNPLGEYALYLGWPTYLIHGTNKPYGVGRRVSRGCIRLYPENIAWLFEHAGEGTPVTVVDQPVKIGRSNGEIYLEVHPTRAQADQIEETGVAGLDVIPDPMDTILNFAGEDIRRIDWAMVDRVLDERRGYPVQITQSFTGGFTSGATP